MSETAVCSTRRSGQKQAQKKEGPNRGQIWLGVRAQLTDLAHATHKQTKTVARYMEKNKEWLVSNDWKSARGKIKQARENLTCLQYNLIPNYYLEGELVHFLDLLWIQYE